MDDVSSCPSEQELLQALQSRHAADLVFTRLGTMLLALNPYTPLTHLYSRNQLLLHLHALDRQLPPHIFEHGKPDQHDAHASGVSPTNGREARVRLVPSVASPQL